MMPLPTPATASPDIATSTFSRSLINSSIATASIVLEKAGVPLPPFAHWSPVQWEATGNEAQEIRDCMLGWDVTDFGSDRFHEIGRILFTLRNGRSADPHYPKSYAEKLLIEPEAQRSPIHFHRSKREDIINRKGGNIIVCLHPVGENELPAMHGTLSVQIDGLTRKISAGDKIRLREGESLTIPPRTFHQFWAEEGTGIPIDGVRYTVSGEVSSVCDDWNDNVFIDSWARRFRPIFEDEPRTCYLCHEYPSARPDKM